MTLLLERTDYDPMLEIDWDHWLVCALPTYCRYPMAAHHVAFWDWVWSIEPGERPAAFVGVWPRGGAKSTSAEAACVALGARRKRRYGLYVCDTQDRADDHVGNVGSMLESERMGILHPDMAERRVGKHGNSRGWRRNRLWTAEGFVIDAIGLDTAARGIKLEDQRPDFVVIDDIDDRHDTTQATKRKVETLTQGVIPAGAEDLAILAIQNLILPSGVFAQLVDGTADFLRRRIISGPIPAIEGMVTEFDEDGNEHITGGRPTWPGQSIERCNEQIDDMGMRAFRREAQHEVGDAEGALVCRAQVEAARVRDHPELDALVVSVDPSGGKGKGHDEQGILAVGRGVDGHGYVLEDRTCSLSPMGWGKTAVRLAVELNADRILCESNYGGEMTGNTIRVAADALAAEGLDDAARFGGSSALVVEKPTGQQSKGDRWAPVSALYGEKEREETWPLGRLHHVGALPDLEAEETSFEPDAKGAKSPNRIDALTQGVKDLKIVKARGKRRGLVDVAA
jgi:hypothetical protein